MDDKTFKELLSTVADWEYPIVGQNGGPAKPRLRAKYATKEPELDESFEDEFQDEDSKVEDQQDSGEGDNHTLPPKITKVKHCLKTCDDCGCEVAERIVNIKRHGQDGPRPHWRARCTACGLVRNPWTGEFNVTPDQVVGVFNAYQREAVASTHSDSFWNKYKTPGFKPVFKKKNK